MTRLNSVRSRQTSRKIYLILGGCIVLLIILFQVGLKSLIGATLFVSKISPHQTDTIAQSSDEDTFYGLLNLDDPPSATNSSKLILTGNVEHYDKVDVYVNGVKTQSATVKDTSFTATIDSLKPGSNTMYVRALTKDAQHSKKTESITVSYKNEPPKLTIDSPHDHDTVSSPDLKINGKTDAGVSLRVNNGPAVVDWQGGFQTNIRLKEGDNQLLLEATDDAGNVTKLTLNVTYHKDE